MKRAANMMMSAAGLVVAAGVLFGAANGEPPPPTSPPQAAPAAEPQPALTDEMKRQAEEMAAMNAPTPMHKLMESICGEFEVTMTVYPSPGAEPQVIKCTATREMILDGRIMQERVEAKGGPMPFTTLIHTAYNADARGGGRFEVNRMSSTASAMMPERGTFDEATRMFTLRGSHDINGMTGSIRVLHWLLPEGKERAEVYLAFDGYSEQFKDVTVPEYKAMVIQYVKKSK